MIRAHIDPAIFYHKLYKVLEDISKFSKFETIEIKFNQLHFYASVGIQNKIYIYLLHESGTKILRHTGYQ